MTSQLCYHSRFPVTGQARKQAQKQKVLAPGPSTWGGTKIPRLEFAACVQDLAMSTWISSLVFLSSVSISAKWG